MSNPSDWPRVRATGPAARMIVLQRATGESTPEPALPPALLGPSTSKATPPDVTVDPRLIARRVYDLLREDLAVGRVRRGHRM